MSDTMTDGRHLDVAAVLPVQHGQRVRLVDEPVRPAAVGELEDWYSVTSNSDTAFRCPACDDIVGTLIWCLDGSPRCVECAMRWRP